MAVVQARLNPYTVEVFGLRRLVARSYLRVARRPQAKAGDRARQNSRFCLAAFTRESGRDPLRCGVLVSHLQAARLTVWEFRRRVAKDVCAAANTRQLLAKLPPSSKNLARTLPKPRVRGRQRMFVALKEDRPRKK